MAWIESAPLGLIWLAVSILLVIAHEVGFRGQRLALRYGASAEGKDDGVAYVISAALALLGLLIAFTFSMAAERFDARRDLVVREANAVGTTYLRVQLLDEPARTSLSRMLLVYVEARQEFFSAGRDQAKLARAGLDTNTAETQLWRELLPQIASRPNATINPSLLEATNQMFDLAASAEAALEARLAELDSQRPDRLFDRRCRAYRLRHGGKPAAPHRRVRGAVRAVCAVDSLDR